MPLDPSALIRSLQDRLRACYVYPKTAEAICAHLQARLDSGEYTAIDDGELLALALTLHLQETCRDEHLWVRWHAEPIPAAPDQLRHDPAWQAERLLEARLDAHGIHRVERLPGNLGLIDLRRLHRPEWSGDALAAAMTLLAHTAAVILDLRNCTGGYPGALALLLSHLLGDTPEHILSIYWRDEDRTEEYWTHPQDTAVRLDQPLYVLTSRATFSAGEALAAILQARKRACLIGEKTDGGAHPGASYRLDDHFEAFIPIGRAFDPLTGADLEGAGVTPDIAIPQEHALTAARHIALLMKRLQFSKNRFRFLANPRFGRLYIRKKGEVVVGEVWQIKGKSPNGKMEVRFHGPDPRFYKDPDAGM